jgi:hypothetical protein
VSVGVVDPVVFDDGFPLLVPEPQALTSNAPSTTPATISRPLARHRLRLAGPPCRSRRGVMST